MIKFQTRNYINKIINAIGEYNFSIKNIVITPDTFKWASERNIKEVDRNIFAFSTLEKNEITKITTPLIILREEFTQEDIELILLRISYNVPKPIEAIREPEKFIVHTALHEVGHIINRYSQKEEEKADDFAFLAMGITKRKNLPT